MSRTLLAIISSGRDNDLVKRHWPYFKLTEWDILGVGTEDKKCEWPEPVERIDTGKIGTKMTPAGSAIFGLIQTELEIWQYFLDHKEYGSVSVVEADNLFVRKPPEHPGDGVYLVTVLPNYSRPGLFATPVYFSTPRHADRQCAEQLLAHGNAMFSRGDVQHFISDRFTAHICQQHRVPWIGQPGWSQSAFYWGAKDWQTAWVRDARAAIKIGCYVLHSCKHQWQLDALSDLIPQHACV